MATTYAGGLSASLGTVNEAVVGTELTTGMGWFELLDESLVQVPTYLDSAGLKAGQAYKRASRTQISKYDVNGDINLEHADRGFSAAGGKGMGWWWRQCLGSSTTAASQMAATPAWIQAHQPGSKAGLSFTAQIGRPQVGTGAGPTIQPFTYRGMKVQAWEFSCSDGELAKLKVTIDGWKENTATGLVSPAFAASTYQAGIFSFADAIGGTASAGTGTAMGTGVGAPFTLGGTAQTVGTAGTTGTGAMFTNVTGGGVAINTIVKGVTIAGQTGLASARYGFGSAGVKREQLENAIPMITGSLDAEFTDRTEFYDKFATNVTTAMRLDFVHYQSGVDASGSAGGTGIYPYRLSFIFPAVKFKTGAVSLNGPDLLSCKVGFEAYDDGANPVMQVLLVSQDQVV